MSVHVETCVLRPYSVVCSLSSCKELARVTLLEPNSEKMFNRIDIKDPINLKGRIKWSTLIRLCIFNILRIINLIYTIHTLFYQTLIDGVYREIAICTTLISSMVATIFAARVLYVCKENIFKTLVVVFMISVTIHQGFSLEYKHHQWLVEKVLWDVLTTCFLFFQTVPLIVQFLELKYAIRCKLAEWRSDVANFQRNHRLMEQAEANAGFLAEMECYLRAAPQQIVQVAVIFFGGDFSKFFVFQEMSILLLFVTSPFFITSFQALMKAQKYRKRASWASKIIHFAAILFLLGARIVAVGSAAAFWTKCVLAALFTHWLASTAWVYTQTRTQSEVRDFFCNNHFFYGLFCAVFGVIFVFRPVNLGEDSSRLRYLTFYGVYLVEDVVATGVWWISDTRAGVEYKSGVIGGVYAAFFVGIALLVLYYKKFHPKVQVEGQDEAVLPVVAVPDEEQLVSYVQV